MAQPQFATASTTRQRTSQKQLILEMIKCAKDNNMKVMPVDTASTSIALMGAVQTARLPPIDLPFFSQHHQEADTMITKKRLLLLATTENDVVIDDGIIIWLNLIVLMFPNIRTPLITNLRKYHYEVQLEQDLLEWKNESGSFQDINITDMDDYANLTANDVLALFGMHTCFMGRLLTTNNADTWVDRRAAAFANACGTDHTTEAFQEMLPRLSYAASVYKGISPKHLIRRLSFAFVYKSAKGSPNNIMKSTCETALVYLYGAEMTPFMQINKYIVCQNPILLAWNEVAKYSDKLIAAYKKFESLGDMGPYAKLMHASHELPEFNRANFDLLNTIAIEIAKMSGQMSMVNYKGVQPNENIAPIVEQAKQIVDYFGGARTHGTEAVDKGILIEPDNDDLRRMLHRGGNIRDNLPTDPLTNNALLHNIEV